MEKALFIDTSQELESFCQQIQKHSWFALDTEFVREKTYYSQLCLIQVATRDQIACIDPLAMEDLQPFVECLQNPDITKVLHAAHQDIEVLYHTLHVLPAPVFDTQIAASLLGHGDQIGYAKLVHVMQGVELDKDMTRTDWAARPLEQAQLSYAEDDVRYLAQVYEQIKSLLEQQGRDNWLWDDFKRLSDEAMYKPVPEKAWLRIKGMHKLKGVQLAVIAELACWREYEAMRSNRPRRWIVTDDLLLDIARRQPNNMDALSSIRGVHEGLVRRHGKALLKAITQAQSIAVEDWPQMNLRLRLEPEQEALVDVAMGLLKQQAFVHQISPGAIATRADVEALILGDQDATLHYGWRNKLVGSMLCRLLASDICLTVKDGRLVIK